MLTPLVPFRDFTKAAAMAAGLGAASSPTRRTRRSVGRGGRGCDAALWDASGMHIRSWEALLV